MTEQNNTQNHILPLAIHGQYVKDFSFENPNAPASLNGLGGKPEMTVNVNMDANPLNEEENRFEVVLHIEAKALEKDTVLFIADLQYAIVLSIHKDVPKQHHHPMLMIEGPKLAFPFARQILADATQNGGFPPLWLNPVDFEGMYRQQYEQAMKKQKA